MRCIYVYFFFLRPTTIAHVHAWRVHFDSNKSVRVPNTSRANLRNSEHPSFMQVIVMCEIFPTVCTDIDDAR